MWYKSEFLLYVKSKNVIFEAVLKMVDSNNIDKKSCGAPFLFPRIQTLPLVLPNLSINGFTVKRERSIKFLGVLLDENITWKDHIQTIENKISKNIGMLFKAKFLLNQKCLKSIYFSFMHCYLTYANIAWGSTH